MIKGHKEFKKRLGAHIRRQRMARRLSSTELAYRTDLSKSMISQLENGNNAASLESLIQIAKVLGIDMNQIVHMKIPKVCRQCRGRGYL